MFSRFVYTSAVLGICAGILIGIIFALASSALFIAYWAFWGWVFGAVSGLLLLKITELFNFISKYWVIYTAFTAMVSIIIYCVIAQVAVTFVFVVYSAPLNDEFFPFISVSTIFLACCAAIFNGFLLATWYIIQKQQNWPK